MTDPLRFCNGKLRPRMLPDEGGKPLLRARHTPFQLREGTEKQSGNLPENAHLLKLCQPGSDQRFPAAAAFQEQQLSPHIRPEFRSGKFQKTAKVSSCDNAFHPAAVDKMKGKGKKCISLCSLLFRLLPLPISGSAVPGAFRQSLFKRRFLLLSMIIQQIPNLPEDGCFPCFRINRIQDHRQVTVAPEQLIRPGNHRIIQEGQHLIGRISSRNIENCLY